MSMIQNSKRHCQLRPWSTTSLLIGLILGNYKMLIHFYYDEPVFIHMQNNFTIILNQVDND